MNNDARLDQKRKAQLRCARDLIIGLFMRVEQSGVLSKDGGVQTAVGDSRSRALTPRVPAR
jgi:hypothetical protein